jgi:hypothetical protein
MYYRSVQPPTVMDTQLQAKLPPIEYTHKKWGDPQFLDWSERQNYIYEMKYGGHQIFVEDDYNMTSYFSQETVDMISRKVTQLLEGVDSKGRTMLIPDETIRRLLGSIYENRRGNKRDMIDMVIMAIVQQVKDEAEILEQNQKLSQWVVQYNGDYGIVPYSELKLRTRQRRPTPMLFGMRY